MVEALKEHFYNDYIVSQFIHYYQQICYILKLKPTKVLEIGIGDRTVSDFLMRRGIIVKTFDINKNLLPDYVGDVRKLKLDEKFDLVLASEVFEHMNIIWLNEILENIKNVLAENGYLIVSLPYSTVRLFPKRGKDGKLMLYEGKIFTHIPFYYIQPLLTLLRAIYRIFKGNLRNAFEYYTIKKYDDARHDVHHWDLGCWPTTIRRVKKIFEKYFTIIEQRKYINTNCIFYILKNN